MARKGPRIPLPEDWPGHVKAGIIHVISLAQIALTAARARSKKRGVVARLRAKVEEQAVEELGERGLVLSEGIRGKGKTFFKEVSRRGLEGVVAKRLESRYSSGERSDAWLKIKRCRKMLCVVLGYVPSEREGFQSLILASELGRELRCVGRVARGFDQNARTRLEKLLRSRLAERAFVPSSMRGQWVEPGLYLTVRYTGLTARGELRSPVFERICEG